MLSSVGFFILWTLVIYWMHRFAHVCPIAKKWHWDHHAVINSRKVTWHWSNIFLFNDTWYSTFDLWFTEVIPTILFAALSGQWWIAIFYYLWAAFIQENVEHNSEFNIYPFITSGKWHLIHHKHRDKNFGLFTPVWDRIFCTYEGL